LRGLFLLVRPANRRGIIPETGGSSLSIEVRKRKELIAVPAERLTALDPAPEDLFMVVEDIMTLCWFRDLVVQARYGYMFEVKDMLSVFGREPNDSLCTVIGQLVRLNDCFLRCQHASVGLRIDLGRQAAEP